MTQPNIVHIICHDLGRHLGCYGIRTVQSPHIDAFAATAIRFDNHFCTAPQCSPSRGSLVTGRYPHANGLMGLAHGPFFWKLHAGERTFIETLHDAGYHTALAGIQHVDTVPRRVGFAEVLPSAPETGVTTCDDVALAATTALPRLAGAGKPFFLQVGFFEPHRAFDHGGAQPDTEKGVTVPGYLPDCPEAREEFAAIQGAVRKMDAAAGRLFEAIDALPCADNTLVIFTTDHGIAFPRAKCSLYDPGIGVALLLRWPARGAAGGRTVKRLTSHVDLAPTILEAAQLPPHDNFQGDSLFPILNGKGRWKRDRIYAEKTYHNIYDPMRAVRTKRYKYIRNFEANFAVDIPADALRGPLTPVVLPLYNGKHPIAELYDLKADPFELQNLAGSDAVRDIERELCDDLFRWMEDTGDPLLHGPIGSPRYRRALDRL